MYCESTSENWAEIQDRRVAKPAYMLASSNWHFPQRCRWVSIPQREGGKEGGPKHTCELELTVSLCTSLARRHHALAPRRSVACSPFGKPTTHPFLRIQPTASNQADQHTCDGKQKRESRSARVQRGLLLRLPWRLPLLTQDNGCCGPHASPWSVVLCRTGRARLQSPRGSGAAEMPGQLTPNFLLLRTSYLW